MPETKSCDAVAFLDLLLEFFEDGQRWIRDRYHDRHGNRCLVGAICYVQDTYNMRSVEAQAALRDALPDPHIPGLVAFNDSRKSFDEIRTLILNARAVAKTRAEQQRAMRPANVGAEAWAKAREEAMLRQYRAGKLAEAEAAARRTQATEQAKRQLLAEIARERAVRMAAGDTRPTCISCPRTPAAPERLAA